MVTGWFQVMGRLPGLQSLEIPLDGIPEWLVAAADADRTVWAAVLEDGSVQAFSLSDGDFKEIKISPKRLPPGMPPLLKVEDGRAEILTAPDEIASILTHPAVLDNLGESIGFIVVNGDVAIWEHGVEVARLDVNALPDARLLVDENGRILLLAATLPGDMDMAFWAMI